MQLRDHARASASRPSPPCPRRPPIARALADPALPLPEALHDAHRILVVGGARQGRAMSAAVEPLYRPPRPYFRGVTSQRFLAPFAAYSPTCRPSRRLHHPTAEALPGGRAILDLVAARPCTTWFCACSRCGGVRAAALTGGLCGLLQDKQAVAATAPRCGQRFNEMNAVRKAPQRSQRSRLPGLHARSLFSPSSPMYRLSTYVIASGPTAADPTTFADALASRPLPLLAQARRGAPASRTVVAGRDSGRSVAAANVPQPRHRQHAWRWRGGSGS